MRKFKLQNNVGAEWDLMDKTSYLNAPGGLGFSKTYSAIQAGSAWLVSDEYLNQYSVTGEMIFFSYARYQAFISFVTKGPLFLMYSPLDTWYKIKCEVQTADKSEFKSGYLAVPVTFLCFGTWHEAIVSSKVQPSGVNGKTYSYTYPYTYIETISGSAKLKNGDLPSPCRLQIFGPIVNPAWALTKAGVRVAVGKVTATIPEGHKLVVDADPATMEIAEYTLEGTFVQNLYQSSDFSTGRFIYAPPGESTLTFSHDGTSDITAYVEVEKLAYSV